MKVLSLIAALLGAFTPLMYFHGQAFYQGRLSYWRLPADMFPLTLEQTLVNGYVAYTLMGVPTLLLIFIYTLTLSGLLYNVNELSKFRWVRASITFLIGSRSTGSDVGRGHAWTAWALAASLKVAGVTLFAFLFFWGVVKVYGLAEVLGKEAGESQHLSFTKLSNPATLELVGDVQSQGFPIVCSAEYCAFLDGGRVNLMPQSRIVAISWPGPVIKAGDGIVK
jgi:hypothetical protein